MVSAESTALVDNWIAGEWRPAAAGERLEKRSPTNGGLQSRPARSGGDDVSAAVSAASSAADGWAAQTVVHRGDVVRRAAAAIQQRSEELAQIVAQETGKSLRDARGEVGAVVEMGFFVAGEGRRFYGRTTTSATPNKEALTVRQPIGVAGLIIAANTPAANVAWKVFPALLCGNAVVLKAAEDAPRTACFFAALLAAAGVPPGAFNIVHGLGAEAGSALVDDPRVGVLSFTGSTSAGRQVQERAAVRLAKVCLEMGGKNPLVVCDDADLQAAAAASVSSAFSNAGQRCAAASRIIVFDSVYDEFKTALLARTAALKVGPSDGDDLGPVINERQLRSMSEAVDRALRRGAKLLAGGRRLDGPERAAGYYYAPTLIEGAGPDWEISRRELFGPICCLYREPDFSAALSRANDQDYGLTAAIHTRSVHRAMTFLKRVRAGVAVVNGPTYGSEPHMPFGGLKSSGTGWREAGTEVLDVYSELKTLYVNFDPTAA